MEVEHENIDIGEPRLIGEMIGCQIDALPVLQLGSEILTADMLFRDGKLREHLIRRYLVSLQKEEALALAAAQSEGGQSRGCLVALLILVSCVCFVLSVGDGRLVEIREDFEGSGDHQTLTNGQQSERVNLHGSFAYNHIIKESGNESYSEMGHGPLPPDMTP